MFRSPHFLEKVDYEWVNLDTPLTRPRNGQHQTRTVLKFSVNDRDIVYDWYTAFFRFEYKFQVLADGANVAADTQSAPVNSSFSLINNITVTSDYEQGDSGARGRCTRGRHGVNRYSPQPLFLLRRADGKTFASNAAYF